VIALTTDFPAVIEIEPPPKLERSMARRILQFPAYHYSVYGYQLEDKI